MDLENIRQQILKSDEFVLAETKRLQYTYNLKYEIRYGLTRDEKDYTESVAEHVYGMHIITDYFLPLEDSEHTLNREVVRQMITWHDIVEVIVGDVISWQKTDTHKENETKLWKAVVPNLPESLQAQVHNLVEMYETQSSAEARFVKAIDKVEPLFHLHNELGKAWCINKRLTRRDAERIKVPYIKKYLYMKRFMEVIHDDMESKGYFYSKQ